GRRLERLPDMSDARAARHTLLGEPHSPTASSPRYWCRRSALRCVSLLGSRRLEPLVLAPVTFKSLPDHELQRLGDEQLIAYVRHGRAAGELAAARRALMFLVYGYERDVKRRLSLRLT